MGSSSLTMGLHIGDTSCAVSVFKNGSIDFVTNEQGSRITPACVAFTEVETLLGEPARGQLVRNPQSTVVDLLRLLGRSMDDEDFATEVAAWRFTVVRGGKDGLSPQVEVNVKGKATTFTPPRLLALLLARLQKDAVAATGEEVKEAVVACPAYFSDAQRAALKEAAQVGGIRVKMLLSAPLCVALLHGHKSAGMATAAAADADAAEGAPSSGRPRQLLVIDLGGSSCEATVVEHAARCGEAHQGGGGGGGGGGGPAAALDEYSVRASEHARGLGGQAVDKKLRAHVVKEIRRRHRVDLSDNARAMGRLLAACEAAKVSLSNAAQATINIEADGADYSSTVSRAALEELTASVATQAAELAGRALATAGLAASRVDALLLAGGACRMPRVQAALAAVCPSAALCFAGASEESVCRGAALAAAMLRAMPHPSAARVPGEITATLAARKRLSAALGVATGGGQHALMAEKRAALPLVRSLRFAPPAAGHTGSTPLTLCELPDSAGAVDVTDAAGDAAAPGATHREVRPVARLAFDAAKVPSGAVALELTLSIDATGSLTLALTAELEEAAGEDGASTQAVPLGETVVSLSTSAAA